MKPSIKSEDTGIIILLAISYDFNNMGTMINMQISIEEKYHNGPFVILLNRNIRRKKKSEGIDLTAMMILSFKESESVRAIIKKPSTLIMNKLGYKLMAFLFMNSNVLSTTLMLSLFEIIVLTVFIIKYPESTKKNSTAKEALKKGLNSSSSKIL